MNQKDQPNLLVPVFTIVMADDDLDDQDFLRMAVETYSSKIKVVCLNNGMELMDYLNNNPAPNIIILDINMPVKNGKEALREIKTNETLKLIPVLIYSTSNSPDEINDVYWLGANSYLTKPKDFKNIVEAIGLICSYWLKTISLPNINEF